MVGGGADPAAARTSPLPSTVGGRGGAATLPLRLVDAWLADPVVRSFLRINRWDDAEWFHRESWAELVAWTDRLERALTPPDARVRRPVERSVVARRLVEAGEASGYQVEGLRAALAGTAGGIRGEPADAADAAACPRRTRPAAAGPKARAATAERGRSRRAAAASRAVRDLAADSTR